MTNDKADFTQGNILKKLVAFMLPVRLPAVCMVRHT